MVLYYSDLLTRYIDRRVCISTHGYIKITGVVADVYEDTVRLIDTVVSDDHDDQGWFSRIRLEEDGDAGPTSPETLIHIHHITAITCLDDAVQDLPPPGEPGVQPPHTESTPVVSSSGVSSTAQHPDALELRLGVNLLSLVKRADNQLLSRITDMRERLDQSLGFQVPKVRVRDDVRLDQCEYQVAVHGSVVDTGIVYPDKVLALGDVDALRRNESDFEGLDGIIARDPVYDLPAVWIDPSARNDAEMGGCTVVDSVSVIVVHLQELAQRCADELLDAEQVATALENLRFNCPHLVGDLYPAALSLGQIHQVLCQLLSEGVGISRLDRIIERLGWQANSGKDVESLVNASRRGLGRSICEPFVKNQVLLAHRLHPELEAQLRSDEGKTSSTVEQLIVRVDGVCREDRLQGEPTALVVPDDLRWFFQQEVLRAVRRLTVIASSEVPRQMAIETRQVITAPSPTSADSTEYKQLGVGL